MLIIYGFIQIWECAHNLLTVESVHEHLLDIYHLRGLGIIYPKRVFLLIPMCKCFPIDLKFCMTFEHKIS